MKEASAQNRQHIPATVSDGLDEVRFASENREVLISMDGMDRVDAEAVEFKGKAGLGDDEPIGSDDSVTNLGEALPGKHKAGVAGPGEGLDGR